MNMREVEMMKQDTEDGLRYDLATDFPPFRCCDGPQRVLCVCPRPISTFRGKAKANALHFSAKQNVFFTRKTRLEICKNVF
jgi:hypothetical protein